MSPIARPVLGPSERALRAPVLTLLLTLTPASAALAGSNRGSVWIVANEPLWALLNFNAAIALSPEPSFYFNRGIARERLGTRQRAMDDYTEAIRLGADFDFACHNRGVELEQQGSRAEATADFEHALKTDPRLAPSRQALQRLNPP